MSYKVKLRSSIRKRIVAWNLPDSVFVEILLRLDRELGQAPQDYLVRLKSPFDGLIYGFTMVDPGNRLREFSFLFHVVYGQDEEAIHVINCAYHVAGL